MSQIPASFAAMDPYLEKWALDTYAGRVKARLSASMEELNDLYHAVFPHMEEVIETLSPYPLEEIPEELKPYGHLVLTVAAYDLAVSRFQRVDVPYSFPLDEVMFPDEDGTREWN